MLRNPSTRMNNKTILTILGIFVWMSLPGQEKLSKQELKQRMKEGRYAEVFESLEPMMKEYPKEADYIYYSGICRVQLGTGIPRAVELLSEVTRKNAHNDSWFYLGRAYMMNYEFDKAEEAFSRFDEKAGRFEKEKLQFTMYRNMCRNARDIYSRSKKIKVLKTDTLTETSLWSYLNKQQINGRFTGTDDAAGNRPGEGIKFSGNDMILETRYSPGKRQKDIFFSSGEDVEIDNFKTAGKEVNSSFDESFVFYDPAIPAMYFTSKGHTSAGGYDIFKSWYDKASGKWSKPVNVGFPVNSPYDEVAYVTVPGSNRSFLASRRNTRPGTIVLYTLENVEGSAEEPVIPAHAAEISKLRSGKSNITPEPVRSTVKEKPGTKNEVPVELRDESYHQMIREALNLQIRSDSIRRISDEKKEQLVSAKYESDKTRIWQEIKILDAKADEIQQKADLLYGKARKMEAQKQAEAQANARELARKAFMSQNKTGVPDSVTSRNTASYGNMNDEPYTIGYRIQVGVFSKPQPDALFKGFPDIYRENIKNGAAFKYYVGLYRKIVDAEKDLVRVKQAGFKDAFITGYYNGKIVPLSRARELELSLQNQ